MMDFIAYAWLFGIVGLVRVGVGQPPELQTSWLTDFMMVGSGSLLPP